MEVCGEVEAGVESIPECLPLLRATRHMPQQPLLWLQLALGQRERRTDADHALRLVQHIIERRGMVFLFNYIVEDGQEAGVLAGRRADGSVTMD